MNTGKLIEINEPTFSAKYGQHSPDPAIKSQTVLSIWLIFGVRDNEDREEVPAEPQSFPVFLSPEKPTTR